MSPIVPTLPLSPAGRLRRVRIALGLLGVGLALVACSPTYDWRTVMNNDSGYTVDLPAKPGADERTLDIDGTPMRMRMQTAEAGDAVFVVGTVTLPDAGEDTQRHVLAYLQTGLAHNLGAAPAPHAIDVPLSAGGHVPGVEMQVNGKAGAQGDERTMHVRLVAKGAHVYQIAIVADREPAPEQVDQFFDSFRLN